MKVVRGNALVGLLLTVAIIAVLVVVMMYGGFRPTQSGRPDKKGKTTLGLVKLDAQDDVCRQHLNQIRQSITINTSSDDQYPATLDALKLGQENIECPIDHKTYEYDPATGVVKCKHPGHEEY